MSLLLLLSIACGPGSDAITLTVAPEHEGVARAFVERLPWERATVRVADDPARRAPRGGLSIAWVDDLDCTQCYALRDGGRVVNVHAGDVLGLQYGTADLLEQVGFRFHHPQATHAPARLGALDPDRFDRTHAPEIGRRGLQMHTLHPIEGLYDFWMPRSGNLDRALDVVDWVVKNRGDHLQWPGLNDILADPLVHSRWQEHTAAIVDEAHARGLTVGVGVQLFRSGNLQQAFDLLEGNTPVDARDAVITERMALLLNASTPFDMVNLSFGEFFAEEPDAFIAAADQAARAMKALSPGLEVTGLIHVGADLEVEHEGERLIYYLLVGHTDELTPWVHTVMYYNLFDDPGGSYHHDDYDQHRTFLLDRLEAGEPVAYFPESAYWIAFDNSLPTWLPIYIRSRFVDVAGVRAATGAPMTEHVLFSSGWEWGYWQNDTAFFRMSWEESAEWGDLVAFQLQPHDPSGALAEIVTDLGDAQYRLLLTERLAPWLASRDVIMEFGYTLDIVSQPVRPGFDAVVALEGGALDAFVDGTLAGLADLEAAHADADERVAGLGLGRADPFVAEIADGVEVTRWRAAFVHALARALVAGARDEDPGPDLADADAALEAGRAVVARRHAALHDPSPERLLTRNQNPTIYQYGYLMWAEELCFWERERDQARTVLLGEPATTLGCAL